MEGPVAEVRLSMDCIGGEWETLDGGRRCLFRGTIRLTQSSLIDPERLPRVVEALVEWEQPTPTVFIPDVSIPSLEIPPIVAVEEEEPVEVPETMSGKDSVNGPAWTSSSEPVDGGSESSQAWRGWLDYHSLPVRSTTVDQSDSAEGVGGSSTALSAVRAEVGQASEPSTSGVVGAASSSSDTPRTDGPSEGGVHG